MIPTRLGQQFGNGFFGGFIRSNKTVNAIVISPEKYNYYNFQLGVPSSFPVETSVAHGKWNTRCLIKNRVSGAELIKDLFPTWYIPSIAELSIILKQFPISDDHAAAQLVMFHDNDTETSIANRASKLSVPTKVPFSESLDFKLSSLSVGTLDPELFSSTVATNDEGQRAALIQVKEYGYVYSVSTRFTSDMRLISRKIIARKR